MNAPPNERTVVLIARLAALDRATVNEAQRSGRDMGDHRMIGKVGRVSGTISPDRLGEVLVPVRGGTEHFHAYAADTECVIVRGTRIVVVEYLPPRTVVVTPM